MRQIVYAVTKKMQPFAFFKIRQIFRPVMLFFIILYPSAPWISAFQQLIGNIPGPRQKKARPVSTRIRKSDGKNASSPKEKMPELPAQITIA